MLKQADTNTSTSLTDASIQLHKTTKILFLYLFCQIFRTTRENLISKAYKNKTC